MAKLAPYTFGAEIECFGIHPAVTAYLLRKEGFTVTDVMNEDETDPNYRAARSGRYNTENWVIDHDGSIEGQFAQEIKSPILKGSKGIATLRKFVRTLKKIGLKVNNSTGLHVHVGVKETEPGYEITPECVYEILKRYASNQQAIEAMVREDRREGRNTYVRTIAPLLKRIEEATNPEVTCEAPPRNWAVMDQYNRNCFLRDGTGDHYWARDMRYHVTPEPGSMNPFEDLNTIGYFGDHYHAVNISALTKYGTLEFRQHHGSLDAAEVVNWVHFVINHVDLTRKLHSGDIGKGRGRKPGMFAGLPVNVREHFKKQTRKLSPGLVRQTSSAGRAQAQAAACASLSSERVVAVPEATVANIRPSPLRAALDRLTEAFHGRTGQVEAATADGSWNAPVPQAPMEPERVEVAFQRTPRTDPAIVARIAREHTWARSESWGRGYEHIDNYDCYYFDYYDP